MQTIDFIDSHSGGEPTRVVVGGFPDLGQDSLAERRARFRSQYDHWRSGIICEPRGYDAMVGALLTPAHDPSACIGVIFFNNCGYLGMCGHGMMGVVLTLQHMGRIGPGRHRIETPVGVVGIELHDDARVSIANVESYRQAAGVLVRVPGHGLVRGDLAWGGNWFFLVDQAPCPLLLCHQAELSAYAMAIRRALRDAGITGAGGAEVDHIELCGPGSQADVDGRNFVLCPGLAYDRSPCGTGTSAKLACLAAASKLPAGRIWRQESIIGSVFEGSWSPGTRGGIQPTITGRASLVASGSLHFADEDPFRWGIGAR